MSDGKKRERFIKRLVQAGVTKTTKILVDRETGVKYLFHHTGYAGGLTPLPDREGKPIVTTEFDKED